MRRFLVCGLLIAVAACTEKVIWLTPQLKMRESAWKLASETYHDGWVKRQERALCVYGYAIKDSVVTVTKAEKPVEFIADSVTVAYRCRDTLPVVTLHTHLIENGWRYRFSPFDTTQAKLLRAPFHILMSDAHAFSVLWKPVDIIRRNP